MNRDDLDAFFAKADDVLDNWRGSDDAMHARVPTDEDAEALPGESYYDQWDSRDVAFTRAELDMPWPATPMSFAPLTLDIELDFSAFNQVMDQFQEQMLRLVYASVPALRGPPPPAPAIRGARADWVIFDEPVLGPRERALQLRRNRNTGPKDRRRLDGRTTRSGATS